MDRFNAKILSALLIISLIMTIHLKANAENLEDQAITWADFSRIVALASSMNYVYAATTSGIIKFDKVTKQFSDPLTGQIGLKGEDILGFWVDTFDEKLMVRTEAGNFVYDKFFKLWTQVIHFEPFENDSRFVPTPDIMFAPIGFNFLAGGNLGDLDGRSYPISQIIDDGTGTLWMAIWGYGLGMAESSNNQIDLFPFGLLQNSVAAIYPDDTLLWVGGMAGLSYRTGLTSFDTYNNEFAYVESGINPNFPVADIYCLTGNQKNPIALYIGCSEGLYVYDKEIGKITDHLDVRSGLTQDKVTALQFAGDLLFVGTTGGICLLDFARDSISYVYTGEFLNQMIYDFELVDSTLWIAAQHGAYRLSLHNNELNRFQDPEMIVFSAAYAIKRQGDHLWFAAEDGLLKLNLKNAKTEGFKGGDLRYIFSGYPFRALAVTDSSVATASRNGFVLFFDDPSKPLYREFGIADGLPSAKVMALEFDGDYIWVGTDSGLTSFWWNNPDRVD